MTAPCPMCRGDGAFLGQLGRARHYRCIHCGWMFSRMIRRRVSKPAAKNTTKD